MKTSKKIATISCFVAGMYGLYYLYFEIDIASISSRVGEYILIYVASLAGILFSTVSYLSLTMDKKK